MPAAFVDDVDDDLSAPRAARGSAPAACSRCLDGVVQQVGDGGVEARRDRSPPLAVDPSCSSVTRRPAHPAIGGEQRLQGGASAPTPQGARSAEGASSRRSRAGVIFCHGRAPTVSSMSRWNSGLADVALGVGQQQGQLARHVLDVMRDEGEALAVVVQVPGLEEHARGALFGHEARGLAAHDAQQVEHLLVKVERRPRRRQASTRPICTSRRAHQRDRRARCRPSGSSGGSAAPVPTLSASMPMHGDPVAAAHRGHYRDGPAAPPLAAGMFHDPDHWNDFLRRRRAGTATPWGLSTTSARALDYPCVQRRPPLRISWPNSVSMQSSHCWLVVVAAWRRSAATTVPAQHGTGRSRRSASRPMPIRRREDHAGLRPSRPSRRRTAGARFAGQPTAPAAPRRSGSASRCGTRPCVGKLQRPRASAGRAPQPTTSRRRHDR